MIKAEILLDSINYKTGDRLTTWILEYPRFIHSEILTHRVMSKNSASSRAIPTNKIIKDIQDNPAMPVWWGKNQSGMQAKEELDENIKKDCIALWEEARDDAIEFAKAMLQSGLHKQIVNRILEPWFNMRVILSGTEYDNFFLLRAHEDAQPEFQELAFKMLKIYNESIPKVLQIGEWHIPFGNHMYDRSNIEECIKVSVARCARVSYLNFDGTGNTLENDLELYNRLVGSNPKHLSPTEHVAQVVYESISGNFKGWRQHRRDVEIGMSSFDKRIISKLHLIKK